MTTGKLCWITLAVALAGSAGGAVAADKPMSPEMQAYIDALSKPSDYVLISVGEGAEEIMFVDRESISPVQDGFYAARLTVYNGSRATGKVKATYTFGWYYCADGVMRDRSAKSYDKDDKFVESYVLKPEEVAPNAAMKPVFDYVCMSREAQARLGAWSSLAAGVEPVVEADRRYVEAHAQDGHAGT